MSIYLFIFICLATLCLFVGALSLLPLKVIIDRHVLFAILLYVFWLFLLLFIHKSCPTLCDPMNCSMPGSPVLHYLQEFAQIHVH